MEAVWLVVWYVLFAFWLLLTARIVVELVRTFAREWHPAGGVAVTLETIYTVTDPPVRPPAVRPRPRQDRTQPGMTRRSHRSRHRRTTYRTITGSRPIRWPCKPFVTRRRRPSRC